MKKKYILPIFILLLAFCFRFPFINKGVPFFYNEDEMHHFSRTVQMVQEGRFDPEYFLKPSLHFYLRIPVTALAFIWDVKKGNINNLTEIQTKNPLGVGQYSQSMSHPRIVKANRLFSLCLSMLTLVLIFFISKELTKNTLAPFFSTALFALTSPEIKLSTQINVDIPVMFFCTLSSFLALKTFKNFNLSNFIILCFLVGFSISTKYNALPIYILPTLVIVLLKKYSLRNCVIALLLPIIAFFIASPYAFLHYNIFLNQLAYEVWHYGVVGHNGHSTTPGISQLLYYYDWFCRSAIGIIPFVCAIFGGLYLILKKGKLGILILAFPVLFITLMIFQKTNFTRNMLMAIPFICIFSGIGLNIIFKNVPSFFPKMFLLFLFFLQVFAQSMVQESNTVYAPKDSRIKVSKWITENATIDYNIFCSGELDFLQNIYNLPNVAQISQKSSQDIFYNNGANFLVLPTHIKNQFPYLFKKEKSFDGFLKDKENRLYVNPSITIYKAVSPFLLTPTNIKVIANKRNDIKISKGLKAHLNCNESIKDCWVQSRISKIVLPENFKKDFSTLNISYITPWKNQKVKVLVENNLIDISCINLKPWEKCNNEITIPKKDSLRDIYLIVDKLISPSQAGFSDDKRFLGIMLK